MGLLLRDDLASFCPPCHKNHHAGHHYYQKSESDLRSLEEEKRKRLTFILEFYEEKESIGEEQGLGKIFVADKPEIFQTVRVPGKHNSSMLCKAILFSYNIDIDLEMNHIIFPRHKK